MIVFDKDEVKSALSLNNIFDLLLEWGGDPEYTTFGVLSTTICHNLPGEGSKKLYYYENSGLFRCYTGCDCFFDIFELVRKIAKIQWHSEYDLNDAVRWIAQRFNVSGEYEEGPEADQLEDWKYLENYQKIQGIEIKDNEIKLKEYDWNILRNFNYNVKITPWLNEGISQEALNRSMIGFYPGGNQITIPHFDKDNCFIGLRGRTVVKEDAERYGKYRPIRVNQKLYNHPLGMNLYNYNKSKKNIELFKKAIIFEGEKSCLKYQTYFGFENDISVACCGSSVSAYQIQLLLDAGAEEIIIAFDRQFQELGDIEYHHLTNNFLRLNERYKNYVLMSFIFDKNKTLEYKASPIDEGPDKFLKLYKERIFP